MIKVVARLSMTSVVAVTLALVACGGGNESEPTSTSQPEASQLVAEEDLAKSMLLTVSDFPIGWAEQPKKEENNPLEKCKPSTEGRTGHAETGDFSKGSGTTISETLGVFDTNTHVSAALETISSIGNCVVKAVNEGALDTDELAYSDASFSPLSFPQHGDRTQAYRIKIHGKRKGQTGIGSAADVFLDLVNVTVGRVGFTVQAEDVLTPFDSHDLDQFVSKAETKVRQASSPSA